MQWNRLQMFSSIFHCQAHFLPGLSPGVSFSKDPKTSRARNPSCKAPETTFGCFLEHPTNFEPEKYVIFPRKLHGYSLPPEKRFRVCFSCTWLIKWRPPTYFLGQNKRPRSCIKRERVEEGRENNVVRKYGIYQNEFQNIIECDAKARGIFILAKLYEVNSIFSAVSSLQNLLNLFNS